MKGGDHDKKNKKKTTKFKRRIFDALNVLPTLWVRLPFQIDNGNHWIVLDSRRYLLWNLRIFLCLLYFTVQLLK